MTQRLCGSSLLADESGVAKTIYGLRTDGFYAADFIDFATIIEHGILGDIVLVPGGTAVPDAMMQLVRELVREGAIRVLANRPPVMPLSKETRLCPSAPEAIFNSKRSRELDARYDAARVAGAELALGRPGMVSIRERSTYLELARPRDEHWVCDLMRNHRRLVTALHAFKKQAAPP